MESQYHSWSDRIHQSLAFASRPIVTSVEWFHLRAVGTGIKLNGDVWSFGWWMNLTLKSAVKKVAGKAQGQSDVINVTNYRSLLFLLLFIVVYCDLVCLFFFSFLLNPRALVCGRAFCPSLLSSFLSFLLFFRSFWFSCGISVEVMPQLISFGNRNVARWVFSKVPVSLSPPPFFPFSFLFLPFFLLFFRFCLAEIDRVIDGWRQSQPLTFTETRLIGCI